MGVISPRGLYIYKDSLCFSWDEFIPNLDRLMPQMTWNDFKQIQEVFVWKSFPDIIISGTGMVNSFYGKLIGKYMFESWICFWIHERMGFELFTSFSNKTLPETNSKRLLKIGQLLKGILDLPTIMDFPGRHQKHIIFKAVCVSKLRWATKKTPFYFPYSG